MIAWPACGPGRRHRNTCSRPRRACRPLRRDPEPGRRAGASAQRSPAVQALSVSTGYAKTGSSRRHRSRPEPVPKTRRASARFDPEYVASHACRSSPPAVRSCWNRKRSARRRLAAPCSPSARCAGRCWPGSSPSQFRQVPRPKHELLPRLTCRSRFLSNGQEDPGAIQMACIATIAQARRL